MEARICVLCGTKLEGFGNNPYPVAFDGLCCDDCNIEKVIPARIGEAPAVEEVEVKVQKVEETKFATYEQYINDNGRKDYKFVGYEISLADRKKRIRYRFMNSKRLKSGLYNYYKDLETNLLVRQNVEKGIE